MLRMVPLPRSVSLRGGGKTTPFSRHIVPELCLRPRTNRSAPGNQRGKRSAERRIQPMPRSTSSCRHEPAPRARRAPQTSVRSLRNSSAFGARSPSGAPHAALAGALTSRLSSRPCFLGSAPSGRYPLACKPSAGTAPPAAVLVPQGVMPEAARERFARPLSGLRDRSRPSDFDCIINDLAPARTGILSVILSIRFTSCPLCPAQVSRWQPARSCRCGPNSGRGYGLRHAMSDQ